MSSRHPYARPLRSVVLARVPAFASTFALAASTLALAAGCSAEAAAPGSAVDDVAASVGRATLDGYWKRADESTVVGFTFNKCIGLDGHAQVQLGRTTATCKKGAPDVGSYLIHGKGGVPVERGTYRLGRLSSASERGTIELFKRDALESYPLEYALELRKDDDSVLRLFAPGASSGHEYRARAAGIPAACEPSNEARTSGEAFLGAVDFNWFRHDYSIGQKGDELSFEAVYASRPFRFDHPACDVQLTPGMVDVDHVNAVCDGAYEVAVGEATQSVVWTERATSLPRFHSLAEALHLQGGDAEGWRATIGTALTPLVDLNGKDVPSCEASLAGDEPLPRDQAILERADNGCKILLAPGGARLVDAAGRPTTRYVQVFQQAVFTSSGLAGEESCVTTR